MINSIIEAISIALNAEFGDDYTTYTEEQEQGLKEPCFFISTLEPTTFSGIADILGGNSSASSSFPLIGIGQKQSATIQPNGCVAVWKLSRLTGI